MPLIPQRFPNGGVEVGENTRKSFRPSRMKWVFPALDFAILFLLLIIYKVAMCDHKARLGFAL